MTLSTVDLPFYHLASNSSHWHQDFLSFFPFLFKTPSSCMTVQVWLCVRVRPGVYVSECVCVHAIVWWGVSGSHPGSWWSVWSLRLCVCVRVWSRRGVVSIHSISPLAQGESAPRLARSTLSSPTVAHHTLLILTPNTLLLNYHHDHDHNAHRYPLVVEQSDCESYERHIYVQTSNTN